MSLGQIIILLFFLSCFLAFSWSIYAFFKVTEKKSGMVAIQYLGILFSIVYLVIFIWFYQSHPATLIVAVSLYSISHMIFWSAIFTNRKQKLSLAYSEDEPQHLVVDGPYRYIRHPFYTSYLCFWLAGLVATMQLVLLVPVWVMFFLYYRAAVMEEQKFMQSRFRDEYKRYRKQTGMFFPRFKVMQYSSDGDH